MANSPLGWKRGVRLKKIKSCDVVPYLSVWIWIHTQL